MVSSHDLTEVNSWEKIESNNCIFTAKETVKTHILFDVHIKP